MVGRDRMRTDRMAPIPALRLRAKRSIEEAPDIIDEL